MLRVLFTICAVCSLLLFLLSAGFWVRGQFTSDDLGREGGYTRVVFSTTRTGVTLHYFSMEGIVSEPYFDDTGWWWASGRAFSITRSGRPIQYGDPPLDFLHLFIYSTPGPPRIAVGHVPHWLILLLTSVAPAMWVVGRRRDTARRRAARGECVACGYDLRGSPTAGDAAATCPECGAARG